MLKMKQLNTFIGLICLLSYTVELIAKSCLIKKNHVFHLYYGYIIACVIWKGSNKKYIQVWQHFLQARFEVIFNILATGKITLNAFIVLLPLHLKVLCKGGQVQLFLPLEEIKRQTTCKTCQVWWYKLVTSLLEMFAFTIIIMINRNRSVLKVLPI